MSKKAYLWFRGKIHDALRGNVSNVKELSRKRVRKWHWPDCTQGWHSRGRGWKAQDGQGFMDQGRGCCHRLWHQLSSRFYQEVREGASRRRRIFWGCPGRIANLAFRANSSTLVSTTTTYNKNKLQINCNKKSPRMSNSQPWWYR